MKNFAATALMSVFAKAHLTIDGDFTFEASYDAASESVIFTTSQPNLTYIGVLLGSEHMDGTDAIVWQANNAQSKALDIYAAQESMPTTDTTQNVISSITSNTNGVLSMRTTRKLTTGDPTDFVVPLDTPFGFAWATNTGT